MKIEFDDEFMYQLKDAVFIEFLKDDLDTLNRIMVIDTHTDDIKCTKKLVKAYRKILDYYGVNDD